MEIRIALSRWLFKLILKFVFDDELEKLQKEFSQFEERINSLRPPPAFFQSHTKTINNLKLISNKINELKGTIEEGDILNIEKKKSEIFDTIVNAGIEIEYSLKKCFEFISHRMKKEKMPEKRGHEKGPSEK